MLLSIFFNFIVGKDMEQERRRNHKKRLKSLFIFAILFNIFVLGFFKYANLFIGTFAGITGLAVRPLNLTYNLYQTTLLSFVNAMGNEAVCARSYCSSSRWQASTTSVSVSAQTPASR